MKKTITILLMFCLCGGYIFAQRHMESLNRGLVAVRTSTNNVFLSWRLLGNDPDSTAFNIYFNSVLLNPEPIFGGTNYNHATSTDGTYYIKTVVKGVEQNTSELSTPWAQNYIDIPLQIPSGGTTPDGVSYTYSPNDCSVGDLDGDGEYELIVKWDPSNSKDNSHSGYTGNVFLDAYKLNGNHLWRIDLGKNIRAGAHYTQLMVFDLDSDGKSEVACKTAPGTKDGSDSYLSQGPASSDNDAIDYRNSSGKILAGPEYLTVFNGETGYEMATVYYNPRRHPDTEDPSGSQLDAEWGDSYGNRVDRFLAGIAYLDGIKPSLVMCRGYYTRTVLAAWDWDGTSLSQRWVFDSKNGYSSYKGQGNHNLSVADVDNDGFDEIIYGSCTIDHDGTGLYTTGLGHGDALHVSDLDPDRPGLEVFMPHENKRDGVTFRDAATGEVIWQKKNGTDVGRGLSADVVSGHKGAECWAASGLGMYNNQGEYVGSIPSINFAIWWDSDDLRELLDGTTIQKYDIGNIFYGTNCSSNNGTKSTPNLQADILGDWREELILRTTDNSKLRIFTTTFKTDRRIYTLMHDPVYRMGVAWQNVGYNQPPHTGFHLGEGMQTPPVSPIRNGKLVWKYGNNWDINASQNWQLDGKDTVFQDADNVLFDISGSNSNPINISEIVSPSSLTINSPTDYTFTGSGSLAGDMSLKKNGKGTLKIENNNSYSGYTHIWGGKITINGSLNSSEALVYKFATLNGSGSVLSVNIKEHGILEAGDSSLVADTLTIINDLFEEDNSINIFDLSDDTTGIIKPNDFINCLGDIIFEGKTIIYINILNDSLSQGTYRLFSYSGSFIGSLDHVQVKNIEGTPFELLQESGFISLKILPPRAPALIGWQGGKNNNIWDLALTKNWVLNGEEVSFVKNDSVLFNDSGNPNNTIELESTLETSNTQFNHTIKYELLGTGSIAGSSDLIKSGTGKLSIKCYNDYTGKTVINGGILEITNISNAGIPSSIGAANNIENNLILNGGTLSLTSTSSSTNRNILLQSKGGTLNLDYNKELVYNGVLSGEGELTLDGNGKFTLNKANTHNGGITLSGGELFLGSTEAINGVCGSGPITLESGTLSMLEGVTSSAPWDIIVPKSANATIKLVSGTYTGKLSGSGVLNIYTPGNKSELLGDWSQFEGQINASADDNGGWLILGNKSGYGKTSINLGSSVVALYRHTANDTIEIGTLTGDLGAKLGAGGEGEATITWKLGGSGSSFDFNGKITEIQYAETKATTAIIKTGQGNMTLSQANEYSKGTTIEQGKLTVTNKTGSATGTGNVKVLNGGSLSGNGFIQGETTVFEGGVISPGVSGPGILTISSNINFLPESNFMIDINTETLESDLLVTNDTVNLDGILYMLLSETNVLVEGDSIKIIEAPNCTGEFSRFIPRDPGDNLEWDTSTLCKDGYLRVKNEDDSEASNISILINEEIMISPNPCDGKFTLSLDKQLKDLKVDIQSINGHLLYSRLLQSNTNKYNIELNSPKSGLYFITISQGGYSTTRKLIIK